MPTTILVEAVSLVLLSKIYLLQNIFRKIELIQTAAIPKYYYISKIVTVHACTPLIRIYARLRFTVLTHPALGYITNMISNKASY